MKVKVVASDGGDGEEGYRGIEEGGEEGGGWVTALVDTLVVRVGARRGWSAAGVSGAGREDRDTGVREGEGAGVRS